MPANTRSGHPLSRRELTSFLGGFGPEYDFLSQLASRDTVMWRDDFLGDAINLDNWAVANGGGSGVASFAINLQRDGWIRGTTGTASGVTASASAIGPAIYKGAANAGIEFRFKDAGAAVTETMLDLGFSDVVPDTTGSVVNSVATPSVNVQVIEAAVYHYRHAGSTTTNQLITVGTAITAQKTNFTPPVAVAAAKSYTVRIQLIKTGSATANAKLWMGGQLMATHVLAMTGDVLLAPWIYIQRTTGTTTHLDIDYVRYWQDRDFLTSGLEG